METQNVLVSSATESEKATFYQKTYLHVALAVLAFILVESLLLKVVPEEMIFSMVGSRGLWLFIIGLFWLGTTLSNKMAFSPSREQQYLGLGA